MNQDASNPFGDAAAFPASLGPPQAAIRPVGLTAVCIVVIILASLGLMSSVAQMANLVGGRQMQQAFSGLGQIGSPEEVRAVQDDFNEAVAEVSDKYFWVNTISASVHFVVASLFLYGGAYTLRLECRGYRVLMLTCLLGIVFEIARSIPFLMIQMEMMPVLQEYMPRMMESSSPSGDRAAEVGASIGAVMARLMAILGIVFFCGWGLVKVVFYGFTRRYLKKADIRLLFESEAVELR